MAEGSGGSITSMLGLDISKFKAGLSEAKVSAAETKESISGLGGAAGEAEGATGGLGSSLAGMAGPAAIGATALAGVAAGAASCIGAATSLATSVKELQDRIGGTPEAASQMIFAFGQAGVSSEEAEKSLSKFSKGLTGLQENEDGTTSKSNALVDQLKSIGVTAVDASGQARSMQDVMGDVAARFATMPDGAEKTALAMQLFGKAGTDLIPFLDKGSAGLADLYKESDKLGLTLNGSTIESVHKMTEEHRLMDASVQGLQVQIGTALIPVMVKLTEGMTTAAVWINTEGVPAFQKFMQQFAPLTEAATQFVTYIQANWSTISAILQPIVDFIGNSLIAQIKSLVDVVVTATDTIKGAFQVISDIIHGNFSQAWTDAKQLVATVVGDILRTLQDYLQPFAGIWDKAKQILSDAWNAIKQKTEETITTLKDDVTALPTAILHAVEGFPTLLLQAGKDLIQGLINGIQSIDPGDAIKKMGQGVLDGAKSIFGIHSPSTEMYDIGTNIDQGLANGITDSTPLINDAIARQGDSVAAMYYTNITQRILAEQQQLIDSVAASNAQILSGQLASPAAATAAANNPNAFGFGVSLLPGAGTGVTPNGVGAATRPSFGGAPTGGSGGAGGGGGGGTSTAAPVGATSQQAVLTFLSQSSGTLSMDQLVAGLLWAGVPQSQVAEMAAILMAENSGNITGGEPSGAHIGLGQFDAPTWASVSRAPYQGANAGQQFQAIAALLAQRNYEPWQAGPDWVNTAANFLPAAQQAAARGGAGGGAAGGYASSYPGAPVATAVAAVPPPPVDPLAAQVKSTQEYYAALTQVNSATEQVNKNITAAGNNPALKDQAAAVDQAWAAVEADASAVIGAQTDDARQAARDQEAIDLARAQYLQGIYAQDATAYQTTENAKLAAAKAAIQAGVKEFEAGEAAKQKAHAATTTATAPQPPPATATAAQPAVSVGGGASVVSPLAADPSPFFAASKAAAEARAELNAAIMYNDLHDAQVAQQMAGIAGNTTAILANTAAQRQSAAKSRVAVGSQSVDSAVAYSYTVAAPGLN